MIWNAFLSDPIMTGRALSSEERSALADYYASRWRAYWIENNPSRPYCCLRCRNRRRREIRRAFARGVVEPNPLARRP